MNDPMPVAAADQQVLITRIFEAPRERCLGMDRPRPGGGVVRPRALRHPARAIHIDLRVGGRYELTMVHRDGGAEFAISMRSSSSWSRS